MASPFPGMDPYIEHPDVWSDFHGALAEGVRAHLNSRIRPRYVARLMPRVTYDVIEVDQVRGIAPDVAVWLRREARRAPPAPAAAAATPASAESAVELELPLRLYTVEIRATDTMELVTAIEILSPVNKRPRHDAYADYQRKRRELLRSSAHLMEIDLLRGGTRPPLTRPVPDSAYRITLSRAETRPRVEVWTLGLTDPLPVLPVPLRDPDPDALLDLGAVIAEVYERGGYEQIIDYRLDPPPPALSKAETEWVADVLRAQRTQ